MRKINQTLLTKLMTFPNFHSAMKTFLQNHFIEDSFKEMQKKLSNILKKIFEMIEEKKSYEHFSSLIKLVETDIRFKLPWTKNEIVSAFDCLNAFVKPSKF